ncbi:plasminogen activator inhibitor 2, macrophage-like [Plutella xylostella]|uniref:plasminogen activator inhibitor 2, macrophage-like n=1 Tax=Plutella xylostella TaxID=51655 RepID=UPI00203221A0|nr:plasminogen activator inhibitor 2, macrophage-like [Plutella xylostella]
MRLLVVLSCLVLAARAQIGSGLAGLAGGGFQGIANAVTSSFNKNDCSRDVTEDFRRVLYDFSTRLYKQVAKRSDDHFALTQYSVWLSLAGIAEALEGPKQQALLTALGLPEAKCLRQKYYSIASGLEQEGEDVTLLRRRYLMVQPDATLPAEWKKQTAGLLQTCSSEPSEAAFQMLRLSAKPKPATALLGDSLDYAALWTTAFPSASIKRNQPFYDDNGKQIGTVDMMTTKRRVKLAHLPILNAKVLELPVGKDGRYSMLMLINLGPFPIRNTIEIFMNTIIVDIMKFMQESLVPLEVSIPMFSLTSEFGLREALEAVGVRDIWGEAGVLPAPKEYYQRVTVNITSEGVGEESKGGTPGLGSLGGFGSAFGSVVGAATGLAAAVGRDFVANRPFMFGLVDGVTQTCLFTGAFSKPQQQ